MIVQAHLFWKCVSRKTKNKSGFREKASVLTSSYSLLFKQSQLHMIAVCDTMNQLHEEPIYYPMGLESQDRGL